MMTRFLIKRHNKFFDDFGVINGHWAKRHILANTTHLYILCNVSPPSSTLVQHCINVTQIFCVYWDTGLQRDVVGVKKLTISIMLTFYLYCHERGVVISHIKTWNVERTRIMGDDISGHMSCNAM